MGKEEGLEFGIPQETEMEDEINDGFAQFQEAFVVFEEVRW